MTESSKGGLKFQARGCAFSAETVPWLCARPIARAARRRVEECNPWFDSNPIVCRRQQPPSFEMASGYFHHVSEWQVAICRECQVAVWPDQIAAHLQNKQHKVKQREAEDIQDDLQTWHGIQSQRSEFQVPVIVDNPVQQLPTYDDGQKCILQPERCQYICRTQEGLRKHWRIVHQWKVGRGRGGGLGAVKL